MPIHNQSRDLASLAESATHTNTVEASRNHGNIHLRGYKEEGTTSARLNAMNVRFQSRLPWELAFSFSRVIQQPALEIWQGEEANVFAAQQALFHRPRCNRAARRGEYNAAMERT